MNECPLERLVKFADVADWDRVCEFAEEHFQPIADHMATWGPHCGAPRSVYRGHVVKMLLNLARAYRDEERRT